MSLINKEPFITPEMIAAWNTGSGVSSHTQIATGTAGSTGRYMIQIPNDSLSRYTGFAVNLGQSSGWYWVVLPNTPRIDKYLMDNFSLPRVYHVESKNIGFIIDNGNLYIDIITDDTGFANLTGTVYGLA